MIDYGSRVETLLREQRKFYRHWLWSLFAAVGTLCVLYVWLVMVFLLP